MVKCALVGPASNGREHLSFLKRIREKRGDMRNNLTELMFVHAFWDTPELFGLGLHKAKARGLGYYERIKKGACHPRDHVTSLDLKGDANRTVNRG